MNKLQLKVAQIELNYEGNIEFTKADLIELIELCKTIPQPLMQQRVISEELISSNDPGINLTTEAIAHKMNCSTGTDLAHAACIHLTLVKGITSFKNTDISKEMRTAKGFFKESYASNLGTSLKTLQKNNTLLQTTTGYSLHKSKIESAKSILNP